MEIKLKDVTFSYNDNLIIDSFSCLIKDNMISAIIGKSGSGKTTLLELIDGLLVPINGYIKIGKVKFDNKNSFSCRKKVGFLFQFPEDQIFNSTIYNEIRFALDVFKCSDVDKKVRDAIKLVGLDESYLDKSPYKISNGERRKVALASVLAYEPDIIILDEPTVGLDNKSRNDFLRLVKSLKKDYGKTIIIVSHDINFLHRFVDYVYLVKDGRIYLEGDKYDVLSNEEAMSECGLKVPDVLHFSNLVLKNKNIKIGYRDEINDLIKDVYRYVK